MSQHAVALTLCLLAGMAVTLFAVWLALWADKQLDKTQEPRQ